MKKTFRLLTVLSVVLVCAFGMSSCSEKSKALRNLEALAEEVDEHGEIYGFSEWQDVYYQYQSINAVIDRNYGNYSQKERNRIMEARSEIKHEAWEAIQDKINMFPALKERMINLFNSVFEETLPEKKDKTAPEFEENELDVY